MRVCFLLQQLWILWLINACLLPFEWHYGGGFYAATVVDGLADHLIGVVSQVAAGCSNFLYVSLFALQ